MKATKNIEKTDEPAIYSVSDIDEEMNNAIETAKKTINDFDIALKNKKNKE
ncbi:MAG: hypothetical protein LBT56_00400 [Prevotellaceae bacterium]|jgi:hypothetical protein|nr:hypothetical protein [Prevotellaceae bacterium]